MRVLVVNSGSSNLKLRVVDGDDRVRATANLSPVGVAGDDEIRASIHDLGPFGAVGHRVVHGGATYTAPVRIDDRVQRDLSALTPLAPLHQPAALKAIDLVRTIAPDAPAVACFDTAFHATMPPAATTYAIPAQWRDEFGVRKYGFHGLAHAATSRRARELIAGDSSAERVITCHLGAGASLAAVVDGRCVDTTMGFTPLDGLVMATRSGSLDPGAVLWVGTHGGLSVAEIAEALEARSGLLGLTGSPHMDDVLRRAANGAADAALAVAIYVHRLRAGIAAMAAAAGGIDALVFSGGVGENAAVIRQQAIDGLGFLGISIDHDRNVNAIPDCEMTGHGPVRTFVLAAGEEIEVARNVRETLRRGSVAGRSLIPGPPRMAPPARTAMLGTGHDSEETR